MYVKVHSNGIFILTGNLMIICTANGDFNNDSKSRIAYTEDIYYLNFKTDLTERERVISRYVKNLEVCIRAEVS